MIDLIAFDVETTGFDKKDDRIIELGVSASWLDGPASWLVFATRTIPDEVVELTGITNEMVAERGQRWKEVWSEAYELFSRADAWVAYNASFDLGFLKAYDYRRSVSGCPVRPAPVIDPYLLVQRYFEDGTFKNKKLETVARHFGVPLERAHRAGDDAHATLDLLVEMCQQIRCEPQQLISDDEYLLGAPMRHLDPFEALVAGLPPTQRKRYNF